MKRSLGTRAQRVRQEAVSAAKRGRREALLLGPLFAAVLFVFHHRHQIAPGLESEVQIASVIALAVLGSALARDIGRSLGPLLLDRVDVATAGTLGFVIRLAGVGIALLVALRIAGLPPRTLAVGGAFTAVIVGLAAQQTLGNLFAGMVLLSAGSVRVGERVRFQGGGLAGQTEGEVRTLGLLYVTVARGADQIQIPNSVALGCAVIPLREPDGVDLVARLEPGVRPSEVQKLLDDSITTPTRGRPHIQLQSIDDGEVVVRINATPEAAEDGGMLADEVLTAVGPKVASAA